MATQAAADPVTGSWRLHIGWGIGTLGASLLLNGFSFLVPFYLTTVLGIAASTAGLLVFAAKSWDIVSNPIMGIISDRTETRWGRRRPYLLLGALIASVSFAVLFSLGRTSAADDLPVIVAVLVLVGTGYTIFNVPYMAMPAEMIDDYSERTRMMSYRVFFIGIGTLVGGAAGQRIAELFGGGAVGYSLMGITIGAGIFFFMACAFAGTARARFTLRERNPVPFMEQLRTGLSNRPFVALIATKFTQLFGLFTSTALVIFVVRFVIGKENPGEWMLYYGIVSMSAQILTIPLWLRICRAIEKQRTYILATVLFCLGMLSWLIAGPDEALWVFCLRALVKGVAAAGLLLMGQSMLPDAIEYDFRRTGLRREGIFSALYSFVEKIAAAVAPSILLFVYAAYGFDSKAPVQTAEAVDGIRIAAGVLPCLYFALSLPCLYFYRLTEKTLKATTTQAG
jgi:GPH family glycoside/pentoside/hexuronide:cation symporter